MRGRRGGSERNSGSIWQHAGYMHSKYVESHSAAQQQQRDTCMSGRANSCTFLHVWCMTGVRGNNGGECAISPCEVILTLHCTAVCRSC